MSEGIDRDRLNRLEALLHRLGSADPAAHIKAITVTNPTASKPYHNDQHCITVALRAAEGAADFGFVQSDQLAITLAGLYHDYNHTSPDDNISRPLAVEGGLMHTGLIEKERHPGFTLSVGEMIFEARHAKRRKSPNRYGSRFVYDADHMQILEPDFDKFLDGLNQETGRKLTRESYLADLRKRKLFTRWSKEYTLVRILDPARFGLTD
jgi:predicted metal-dependent HD superfamily phosphohydrolase